MNEPLKHQVVRLDPVALGKWANLGRDEDEYLSLGDNLCLGLPPQVKEMLFRCVNEEINWDQI